MYSNTICNEQSIDDRNRTEVNVLHGMLRFTKIHEYQNTNIILTKNIFHMYVYVT